jgi:hypothetical protein
MYTLKETDYFTNYLLLFRRMWFVFSLSFHMTASIHVNMKEIFVIKWMKTTESKHRRIAHGRVDTAMNKWLWRLNADTRTTRFYTCSWYNIVNIIVLPLGRAFCLWYCLRAFLYLKSHKHNVFPLSNSYTVYSNYMIVDRHCIHHNMFQLQLRSVIIEVFIEIIVYQIPLKSRNRDNVLLPDNSHLIRTLLYWSIFVFRM